MTVFSTILCNTRSAVFALVRERIRRIPLARSAPAIATAVTAVTAAATAATATRPEARGRSFGGQELVLANLAFTVLCAR